MLCGYEVKAHLLWVHFFASAHGHLLYLSYGSDNKLDVTHEQSTVTCRLKRNIVDTRTFICGNCVHGETNTCILELTSSVHSEPYVKKHLEPREFS
jgi:hypothetical protein